MNNEFPFSHIALIGLGLMGASLAHKIKQQNPKCQLSGFAPSKKTRKRAQELALTSNVFDNIKDTIKNADLIILCAPPGSFAEIAVEAKPHLKKGAVLSDVGSFKKQAIEDIVQHIRSDVHFVPAHPIAGTENSGINAGFAEIFENRWCILTPLDNKNAEYLAAVEKVKRFWRIMGSKISLMDAKHHDRVLALTSHLPHIIAWTIIAAAENLPNISKKEIIDYSGGGFKDFTRLASSDPIMWRDVLLGNQQPVIEMIDNFTKELEILRSAIENKNGDFLQKLFSQTRSMRALILKAEAAAKKNKS